MALSLTLTGTFLFLKQSKDSTTEKKAEKDTSPRNGGKELLTALTIFVALLLSSNVYAFRTEKTKKFEGKFNTSADDWCVIKNKFGQVRIIPSEDATLSYTAEVKVSAGSEKKAQELLDGIVVSAVKEGKYVRMTTETASVTCNNCSMEINYTVKMPVKLNLDLENKFGNADIQHVEGKSVINVKHGRLNVMKLSDKHENIITNEFGNTDADEIGNTSLTLRHSNGKINKALKCDIILQHSNLKGGSFENLSLDSRHSNVALKSVSTVKATLAHSNFSSDLLIKSASINAKHGSVEIADADKNFEYMNIENAFGNVLLTFQQKAAFQYKLFSEFGNIKNELPNSENNIKIIQNTSSEYGGKVNGGGKSIVEVKSRHGNIKLR